MRTRLIVGVLGLAAGALTLLLIFREEGDPLTREALDAARKTWRDKGPSDYKMDIHVEGRQSGEHHVEVRGGRVVKMTTGGAPASEHVWEFWSVDGMFEFLTMELNNASRAKATYGADDDGEVVLAAAFDDEYGYPRRFFRHVMGKQVGIEWEDSSFQPLQPR